MRSRGVAAPARRQQRTRRGAHTLAGVVPRGAPAETGRGVSAREQQGPETPKAGELGALWEIQGIHKFGKSSSSVKPHSNPETPVTLCIEPRPASPVAFPGAGAGVASGPSLRGEF